MEKTEEGKGKRKDERKTTRKKEGRERGRKVEYDDDDEGIIWSWSMINEELLRDEKLANWRDKRREKSSNHSSLLDDVVVAVVVVVSASHQNPQDFNDDTSSSAALQDLQWNVVLRFNDIKEQLLELAAERSVKLQSK